MELLIDTNVILDMVFQRAGCDTARELFRESKETGAKMWITASAVTDLFYIIRKETHDMEMTYQVMQNILKLVEVLSVTDLDIRGALEEHWKDFEDCVQYTTAKNNGVDFLVTGNGSDYKGDSVKVISPKDCLMILKKNK